MHDNNFIIENNAKHLWHPMGAPGDSINNPPKVIKSANGSKISDIDEHTTVDAVGGLWCLVYSYPVLNCRCCVSAVRSLGSWA